jgi:hypothetical protein
MNIMKMVRKERERERERERGCERKERREREFFLINENNLEKGNI